VKRERKRKEKNLPGTYLHIALRVNHLDISAYTPFMLLNLSGAILME